MDVEKAREYFDSFAAWERELARPLGVYVLRFAVFAGALVAGAAVAAVVAAAVVAYKVVLARG